MLGLIAGVNRWVLGRREGPRSDRKLLHEINVSLVGEKVTELNKTPPPGLIQDVANVKNDVADVKEDVREVKDDVKEVKDNVAEAHANHAERLGDLEEGQQRIIRAMLPNGLKSDMPGDVLQHVLRQNEAIMERLGINPEEYDPKAQNTTPQDSHH